MSIAQDFVSQKFQGRGENDNLHKQKSRVVSALLETNRVAYFCIQLQFKRWLMATDTIISWLEETSLIYSSVI